MTNNETHEEAILGSLRHTEDTNAAPLNGAARREAFERTSEVAAPLAPDRVTVAQVRAHPETQIYLDAANEHLKLIGYTEHGVRHASLVSNIAANVLTRLDYPQRHAELAAIAGLLHDIGNTVNREMHGQLGALIARDILRDLGMEMREIVLVMAAIGNHEEERGHAISPVAAALILADKADVHRSRVHTRDPKDFDIHDRVNYAATRSFLRVDKDTHMITLELTIDTSIASVMDYFTIFLSRMIMCRQAAEFLGSHFTMKINGTVV
jgi:metal-dependent HD superfamily phosphatase/phosphodiesterase